MAYGFGPSPEEISRQAADRWEAARRQAAGPAPTLPPFFGAGGVFPNAVAPSFRDPLRDRPEERPIPEIAPAPWEYGPPAPSIPPPPMGAEPSRFSEPDMPGVLSGASSTAGPSVGLPPPPQPSGLRVKLQGGDWQEADPEGRLPMPPTERSGTAYDPFEGRTERVSAPSGGGTFSMMTAPENVDLATRGSQLEDAEFGARMRDLEDPLAQRRAMAEIDTDERIRFAEAQDRISMGKQAKMAQEAEGLQRRSDQDEFALAQKYGIDPRDTEGTTIQDEARRMQYQQEREALKREVQARMTILLSRFGMAPRSAAGYEALSGF